ncbi:hypothetical protein ACJX0J_016871, partial [Zea mays]
MIGLSSHYRKERPNYLITFTDSNIYFDNHCMAQKVVWSYFLALKNLTILKTIELTKKAATHDILKAKPNISLHSHEMKKVTDVSVAEGKKATKREKHVLTSNFGLGLTALQDRIPMRLLL